MSDLISKKVIQDALVEKISRLNAEGSIKTAKELCRCKRFVDGITPVTDRPMGEWIKIDTWKYCSKCGWTIYIEDDRAYNYCPNCGVKMDGEEYERAVDQLEHDILYESTFNPEDGSM